MTVIPGACAAITALTLSGLPAHNFTFEGSCRSKAGPAGKKLEEFKNAGTHGDFLRSRRTGSKNTRRHQRSSGRAYGCVRARIDQNVLKKQSRAPPKNCCSTFTSHPPKGEFVIFNCSNKYLKEEMPQPGQLWPVRSRR